MKKRALSILTSFLMLFMFSFATNSISAQADTTIKQPGIRLNVDDNKDKNGGKPEINNPKVTVDDGSQQSTGSRMNSLIRKYKIQVVGFLGISLLSIVAIFIYEFTALAKTANNSQQRSKIVTGIAVTVVATALLGAVTVIVGLALNSFG